MKILKIKASFKGIYEWGSGFVSAAAADKWHAFWKNYSGCFWRTTSDWCSTYIVSVGGGGMIHPMGFDLVCREQGDGAKRFLEVDELRTACENIAAGCGGSVDFECFEREI